MQLPTSVVSSPYTAPSVDRSSQQREQNRQAQAETSVQSERPAPPVREPAPAESAESRPERSETAAAGPQDRVNDAARTALTEQDNRIRSTASPSTGNRATDNYQQIAQQGAQNAQVQDPGLFRIDVYV